MLNTVLFLIFWTAYIIPIAIPLLWLVFTIVMHSRQENSAYVNKEGKIPVVLHTAKTGRIYAHNRSEGLIRLSEEMGLQENVWVLPSRKIPTTSSAGDARLQAVRSAA
jgi:hypothetical protein